MSNFKTLRMEKHRFFSVALKATACAFLSMGFLPTMAETGSTGLDAVEVVQQQTSLRGTVKDANGEPIIGANVLEKGTTNGVITDFDGNFTLSVSRNATLVVSYIGSKNKTIKLTKEN